MNKYFIEVIERQTITVVAKDEQEAESLAFESDAWTNQIVEFTTTLVETNDPHKILEEFERDGTIE